MVASAHASLTTTFASSSSSFHPYLVHRQLVILPASVKKDLEYYAKEHAAQRAKIDVMRAEGRDEYDVRKQEEVLLETETMLPDCQTRLREAASDLQGFLDTNRADLAGLEALQEAETLLATIPPLLQ
jgi:tubulin-specific chaperone A